MKKYEILDNRGRVAISAPWYMAPMLDAALLIMSEQRNCSVSDAARKAIISYARLMRGVDVEQAAAVLALARWLRWINGQSANQREGGQ